MEYSEVNTSESTPRQVPIRQIKKRRFGKTLLLLLSYVIVGAVVWQVATKINTDPSISQARSEAEAQKLLKKVSSLILLPSDEVPQIIPITDAENLAKNQLFFAKVENGDQLLVFTGVQQAIIYRPSIHKIVNTGPIVAGNSPNSESAPAETKSKSAPETSKSTDSEKSTASTPKKASDSE